MLSALNLDLQAGKFEIQTEDASFIDQTAIIEVSIDAQEAEVGVLVIKVSFVAKSFGFLESSDPSKSPKTITCGPKSKEWFFDLPKVAEVEPNSVQVTLKSNTDQFNLSKGSQAMRLTMTQSYAKKIHACQDCPESDFRLEFSLLVVDFGEFQDTLIIGVQSPKDACDYKTFSGVDVTEKS